MDQGFWACTHITKNYRPRLLSFLYKLLITKDQGVYLQIWCITNTQTFTVHKSFFQNKGANLGPIIFLVVEIPEGKKRRTP